MENLFLEHYEFPVFPICNHRQRQDSESFYPNHSNSYTKEKETFQQYVYIKLSYPIHSSSSVQAIIVTGI